ncbi:MAG: hypothetical protein HY291_17230 [Planctomycetes bacterium]|nr:hypothetical protein [Planctomycetota bacterium]
MNEVLLQIIHRAIRSDRAALRSLIERYQGLTYALAYRHCKRFPQAQRIAQAAWPMAAAKLPVLSEPERFLDLLSASVERAAKVIPATPLVEDESEGAEHSVLKTEKVQWRRLLRQALADCPLPEASIFFLRYVEGLSIEDITDLYGVEALSVVKSLRAVCVDLSFRAGFAGPTRTPPDLEALPPDRREALGFAVELAEGGVSNEVRMRVERFIQTDADARREDEAVKQVMSLATRTFAAHRLPPEFVKDVLMTVPYADAPRVVSLPRTSAYGMSPASAQTTARQAAVHAAPETGMAISLGLAGAVVGLVVLLWVMDRIAFSRSASSMTTWMAGSEASIGLVLFLLGGGTLGIFFTRPPLRARHLRLPPLFMAAHGLATGLLAALLFLLLFDPYPALPSYPIVVGILLPLWATYVLALVGLRARWAFMDLEKRLELRLRRMEDMAPVHLPAAGSTSVPAVPAQASVHVASQAQDTPANASSPAT